jgi:H+-transporting ATPase
MIVVMSLLDDVPIMTIAYDRTAVSATPIRWRMPRLLFVSAVLGFASIVQSFGLLLVGMEVLSDPHLQNIFGLHDRDHLQTVMFLQLVAGGHLLLLVTRKSDWFLGKPYPAPPLLVAIVLTQMLAVLMCGFGWIVPAISWSVIAWVWLYLIVWIFILGLVRIATERMVDNRLERRRRSTEIVNEDLRRQSSFVTGKRGAPQ